MFRVVMRRLRRWLCRVLGCPPPVDPYLGTQPLPTLDELKTRLGVDIAHYGKPLPERVAIAWRGYFAALLEWSLLSVADHDRLLRMLPDIEDDPVTDIMLGRE